jgi:hypothetical protein
MSFSDEDIEDFDIDGECPYCGAASDEMCEPDCESWDEDAE